MPPRSNCDYEAPESATTVNVLAYNSSAIDPFTDTMVSSCTKDDVTVKHDPIDFGGQVTKTTATLAGDTGTYDILETYGFVIPGFATDEKLVPLDDLFEKYADDYGLNDDQRVDAHGHVVRRPALRAPDAGADVRHGLPCGRLRRPRARRADDLPRDDRGCGSHQGGGTHGVPDRAAVARDRRRVDQLPGDDELAGRRLRHRRRRSHARHPGGAGGARGDARTEALHGPAGDDLRPAEGAAADVQRHGRDVDHVLGPDERPDARHEQPAGRQLRLRRPAQGQRRGGVRSTTAFRSTAGPFPFNTEARP